MLLNKRGPNDEKRESQRLTRNHASHIPEVDPYPPHFQAGQSGMIRVTQRDLQWSGHRLHSSLLADRNSSVITHKWTVDWKGDKISLFKQTPRPVALP